MKFSREFANETEARTREATLQRSGYMAWSKQKADGYWEVCWTARH